MGHFLYPWYIFVISYTYIFEPIPEMLNNSYHNRYHSFIVATVSTAVDKVIAPIFPLLISYIY